MKLKAFCALNSIEIGWDTARRFEMVQKCDQIISNTKTKIETPKPIAKKI